MMQPSLELLVCPRDKTELSVGETSLECSHGHRFPIYKGVLKHADSLDFQSSKASYA